MSCPQNPFGQPACHITAHPDRPHEKFCATCQQQFIDSERFGILHLFFILVLALLLSNSIQSRSSQISEPSSVTIDRIK